MAASATLVQSIRAILRERGMTYRDLARALGVSEPTVKRNLSRRDFALSRLDEICAALEVSLGELLEGAAKAPQALTQLSAQQEQALVRDPRLLLVTYLLASDWKQNEIVATFQLDPNQLVSLLLRLDALRIIEFRPPQRVRRLTARNFSWRHDGPVQQFFVKRVAPEFLGATFDGATEDLHFLGGTLSAASMARMKSSIAELAREFDELARADSRLPLEFRDGCSALLALRKWEFSEFTRLRRKK